MATPIFVLGWGRSGTTWLANMLLEHPAIAGVHHEKHWGIHESDFFSRLDGRYGPLTDAVNFVEFTQVAAASDYFRLAGADAAFLYSLYPSSYAAIFRAVMDAYADQNHATHWVEKTPAHTRHAESIARNYPDARFLAIIRQAHAVAASRLEGLQRRAANRGIRLNAGAAGLRMGLWALIWQHYANLIDQLRARYPERTLVLGYENLVGDTEGVMRTVCAFLRLDFEPGMLNSRYPPNSRLRRESGGKQFKTLTAAEQRWMRCWTRLARIMPQMLLSTIYNLGVLTERQRQRSLPVHMFRLLPNTPQSLARELTKESFF